MQGLRLYIPPTYPLLRKLSHNALQQNKEENQERGRHGIQETVDPTQEGSERKPQAESCIAGLKSNHSRLEQEDGGLQEGCLCGETGLQATGSMIDRLDKPEDMLKAHHSFVNKKKERQLETPRKIKSYIRKLQSKYEAN